MPDFYIEKKIYYHDTDCGGVVYYANYLKYMEEARAEYFTSKGVDLKDLFDEGIMFVVAKVEVDYKAPARYHDTIKVFAKVEKIRISAIQFAQEVSRGSVTLVTAKTILVCIGKDFKPVSVPNRVKERLLSGGSE